MPANSTPRLSLPDWLGNEPFLRTDFNAAWSTIDQWVAIAEHGTAAATSIDATDPDRENSFYFQTTTGILSWSDGSAWHTVITEDRVGNGLEIVSNEIAVNAGNGLKFSGGSLAVDDGATIDISGGQVIVAPSSLDQTQAASTYRFARTGTPSTGVAQGDLTVDATDNLYVRTASAWSKPKNLPWGIVGLKTMPAGSVASVTNNFDVAWNAENLQVATTLVASRTYKFTAIVPEVLPSTSNAIFELKLLGTLSGSTNSYGREIYQIPVSGSSISGRVEFVLSSLTAGSWTWKIQFNALSMTSFTLGSTNLLSRSYLSIEDIGPAI